MKEKIVTKVVTIRISQKLHDKLEDISKEEECRVADVLRTALKFYAVFKE